MTFRLAEQSFKLDNMKEARQRSGNERKLMERRLMAQRCNDVFTDRDWRVGGAS